ncbi:MAG: cytochrome c [Hyphomicrobiales bacterium]|uniref:c-type cytochrome n=1 Tax=Rhabdaerophilum calidifontis TaxID=2604328 RepID=UPI001238871B|nr:cytochrome c [Rhabdaerophilum calidifontis]MCA1952228.1 cytochrome c [Hyphomicrobiales bacterium]
MWGRILLLGLIGAGLILLSLKAFAAGDARRGGEIAADQCGRCHAIGRTGTSPLAAAPPLRVIARRWPPEQLQEAFAEGVVTGHTAMPEFRFEPGEIDDLIAYLRRLRR